MRADKPSALDSIQGLDDLYTKLLDAHEDLNEIEASRFNSCLILLLAHQVGDIKKIERSFAEAQVYATADSKLIYYC